MRPGPPRLVYAVTVPLTARAFLSGQLGFVRERGWDVLLVSSPGPDLDATAGREQVRSAPLSMNRLVSPRADLRALIAWVQLLRQERPLMTNVSTPKAGLLAGLAAWATRVPIRIYVLRGLRLEGARGWEKAVLYAMEWCACRTAHRVVCVSPSLRREAVAHRLVRPERAVVIRSSNGVDVARFAASSAPEAVDRLRESLGLRPGGTVLGFVGRWSTDKGIAELVSAFLALVARGRDVRLLLVGGLDQADPVSPDLVEQIRRYPDIAEAGDVADTAPYYALMDVLVLPTHREGLPNVVLEAAAAGLPVVSTTATGAIDAVRDGETGFSVPVDDAVSLAAAMDRLVLNPGLRVAMGRTAAAWVAQEFDRPLIWAQICDLYDELAERVPTSAA